ncbi:MAG: sulfurtransferase TusA family protein [Pseudomonadota bacterium]
MSAEVDARGLLCPLPVLKARKRLKALAPGEVLEMLADDPAAVVDVPHFCAEQGHELIGQDAAADGATLYRIRKGG